MHSDILKDLPSTVYGKVAQVGILVVVAGVYPIMLQPMVAPLRRDDTWAKVAPAQYSFDQDSLDEGGPDAWNNEGGIGLANHRLTGSGTDSSASVPLLRRLDFNKNHKCYKYELIPKLATVLLVGGAMGFGFFITDLGFMNVINGSLSITLAMPMPALVGIYLLDYRSTLWKILMFVIFSVGAIMTVVGLFFTENNATSLMEDCIIHN